MTELKLKKMPATTPEENLIHVKFENREAILSREGLLSSQLILLKIARAIREYNFYRSEEAELKSVLYQKIKELLDEKDEIIGILKELNLTNNELIKEKSETIKKLSESTKLYEEIIDLYKRRLTSDEYDSETLERELLKI